MCPFCKGELEPKLIHFPVQIDKGFVVISGLPAEVCKQCGERFLSQKVMQKIEEIMEKRKLESYHPEYAEVETIGFDHDITMTRH